MKINYAALFCFLLMGIFGCSGSLSTRHKTNPVQGKYGMIYSARFAQSWYVEYDMPQWDSVENGGYGDFVSITSGQEVKWLSAISSESFFVSSIVDSSNHVKTIRAFPDSMHKKFNSGDINELRWYARNFPDSPEAERIMVHCLRFATTKESMAELALLFPSRPAARLAKLSYVERCWEATQCFEAMIKWSDIADSALSRGQILWERYLGANENRGYELVREYPVIMEYAEPRLFRKIVDEWEMYRNEWRCQSFIQIFPQSRFIDSVKIILSRVITKKLDEAESIQSLSVIAQSYPEFRSRARNRAIDLSLSRDGYIEFVHGFPTGVTEMDPVKKKEYLEYVVNHTQFIEVCAEISKSYPEYCSMADDRAVVLARHDERYDDYVKAFPNGKAVKLMVKEKVQILIERSKRIDADLKSYSSFLQWLDYYARQYNRGESSAYNDLNRIIQNSTPTNHRLKANERYMNDQQRQRYLEILEELESIGRYLGL